jgi:hypothetical protein
MLSAGAARAGGLQTAGHRPSTAAGTCLRTMSKPGAWESPVWRYAGLGVELAASVAVCVALGWWVDHRFATAPWGVLAGALIGLSAGMYNLVRRSLEAARGSGGGRRAQDEQDLDSESRNGGTGPGSGGGEGR